MDKKDILLINEGFSDNLGDQAIKDSMIFLLRNEGVKEIKFSDFTKNIDKPLRFIIKNNEVNDKQKSSIIKKIIPVKIRWILLNIVRIKKVSKANKDIVLIGGGQLILSNDTFAIAMFLWIFCLRLYGNKNIYLVGVGCGVNFSFLDKKFYRYALNKVKDIYVRDKKSQQILLEQYGIKTKFIYDVAFVHSLIHKKEGDKRQENTIKTLVGVVDFQVYNRYNKVENVTRELYYESWISVLKKNQISLKEIELFYTTQNDMYECKRFVEYIKKRHNMLIPIAKTDTKDALIKKIISAEKIISARMHALILAISYGKKIVTYKISDKLMEFDRMFGQLYDLNLIQNQIQNQISSIVCQKKY